MIRQAHLPAAAFERVRTLAPSSRSWLRAMPAMQERQLKIWGLAQSLTQMDTVVADADDSVAPGTNVWDGTAFEVTQTCGFANARLCAFLDGTINYAGQWPAVRNLVQQLHGQGELHEPFGTAVMFWNKYTVFLNRRQGVPGLASGGDESTLLQVSPRSVF